MTAPVPLVLDLWALGHSARDIGEKLGITRKRVSKIVEQARDIGDPRAVLHAGKNGNLIGRPGRMAVPPRGEVVPSTAALVCRAGHPQTRMNVDDHGHCLPCRRIYDRQRPPRGRK